jgi:hypothetical protein
MGVRNPLWARVNPHTEAAPVKDVTVYSEDKYDHDPEYTHWEAPDSSWRLTIRRKGDDTLATVQA